MIPLWILTIFIVGLKCERDEQRKSEFRAIVKSMANLVIRSLFFNVLKLASAIVCWILKNGERFVLFTCIMIAICMHPARMGHVHFVHGSLPSEYVILYGNELCMFVCNNKKNNHTKTTTIQLL